MSVILYKSSIKLQFMLTINIIFIFLTISRINNNSFSIANKTINNENEFNIITFTDLDCFLKALNNIKNIVKLDTKLFPVTGVLSYKKSYRNWFDIKVIRDLKTKIDYFTIVKCCRLLKRYSI
jgi:hypothetical protein